MRSFGLGVPGAQRGHPTSKGSGITREDGRRNARKARLRALVPYENAVAGLDLGEKRQALAMIFERLS